MNYRILTSVVFVLVLISCTKQNDIIKSEIVVGEYSNMMINSYDTTLIGGYNSPETFSIDLNNDGIDDISFESELWGSPAVGQHPKALIKSLSENVHILGFHTKDTMFMNQETSIIEAEGNIVEIYKQYHYTCHRINHEDSILSIDTSFKLKPLNHGDLISISDMFQFEPIVFVNDGYSYPPSFGEINNDTMIIEVRTFHNDCYDFPLQETKYIGVKFISESKLGWIKLSLIDKLNLSIQESGYQK